MKEDKHCYVHARAQKSKSWGAL